jgi:hypothetical protein
MTAFNHAWKTPQMGSRVKEGHAVQGNGKIKRRLGKRSPGEEVVETDSDSSSGYETEADVDLFLEELRKAMVEEAEKEETATKEDNAN